MNKDQMLAFMNANPVMQLATLDAEGRPRVRAIAMFAADAEGILFHVGGFKDVYAQLRAAPAVEAAFMSPARDVQLRVRGEAREVEDAALKERIVNAPGREFLKPVVAARGLGAIKVFRIAACRAAAWSMAANGEYPKPEIAFG